jgi:hypothetical protein
MIKKINGKIIYFHKNIQRLCNYSPPQYPKGCPNYGKKKGCPPGVPLIDEVLDLSKSIYIIWTDFNVGKHAKRMKKKHPLWSKKQAYCCRYWQSTARKIHRLEIERWQKKYNFKKIVRSPEAHGVQLFGLMKKIAVVLEWPPRKITRVISLAQ